MDLPPQFIAIEDMKLEGKGLEYINVIELRSQELSSQLESAELLGSGHLCHYRNYSGVRTEQYTNSQHNLEDQF